MGRGRPIALLALDGAERETLEQWTRRPKTAQALALRARIYSGLCRWPEQHWGGRRVAGIR